MADEITDAELAELRALPALLSRLERAEKERDESRALLNAARRAVDLPRIGECEFEGRDRMAAFLGMMTMHKAGIATFNDENDCEVYIAQWLANRGRSDKARVATLEKERDEARTELRAFIGNVEEMTLGEGVPAGLVVMDPGSDRPRAVSSHVTTKWYEAIMDKWHRDKDDLIAMYERGQREAMHAPLLRARVATLEAALREEHAVLEKEYGHGVANGYFPDIAPVLDRGRAALRGLEGK